MKRKRKDEVGRRIRGRMNWEKEEQGRTKWEEEKRKDKMGRRITKWEEEEKEGRSGKKKREDEVGRRLCS